MTRHSTLSDNGTLRLTCPRAWREMTQDELRYALHVVGCGLYNSVEGRTLLLLRLTGIKVEKETPAGWACSVQVKTKKGLRNHPFFMQAWQVQDMIGQLTYVDSYETYDVRLESISGFKAADVLLHGVSFHGYLQAEKYYQGFLATHGYKYALGLARILYPDSKYSSAVGIEKIDDAELTNCIMWFAHVKQVFAKEFRHFFKPVSQAKGGSVNWVEQMNAQVRALTDGDITKEEAVFAKDCWRALTELDAKAREAEDFRRKYPKK